MGVLSDEQIEQRLKPDSRNPEKNLCIKTFHGTTKEPGKISWGLSSYGYDIRLAPVFKLFLPGGRIDPKRFDLAQEGQDYRTIEGDHLALPPHGFALGSSLEWFDIPQDVLATVMCKSTYARSGICLNMTPLEPRWRGYITLEIANLTPCEVVIYANEGIGQVIFHEGSQTCRVPYNKKPGSQYQDQGMVVGPKV